MQLGVSFSCKGGSRVRVLLDSKGEYVAEDTELGKNLVSEQVYRYGSTQQT